MRIWDVNPDPTFSIPDSGSKRFRIRIKFFSIFNLKNCFWALGKMIWDVHPWSGYFSHPGSGFKGQNAPDLGSATLSLRDMQSNTLKRRGKFMFKILDKIHVVSETESGPETIWKVGSGSEKNHSGSTTLLQTLQSQPGGGSLRQGVRVPRRELQHGAGREGDLSHPQVSPTNFYLLNFFFTLPDLGSDPQQWEKNLQKIYIDHSFRIRSIPVLHGAGSLESSVDVTKTASDTALELKFYFKKGIRCFI